MIHIYIYIFFITMMMHGSYFKCIVRVLGTSFLKNRYYYCIARGSWGLSPKCMYVPKSLTVILLARLLIDIASTSFKWLAALLGGPSKVVNFPIHKCSKCCVSCLILGPFVRSSTMRRDLVRIWSHQLNNRELGLLFQRLSPLGMILWMRVSMTLVVEWPSENRFFLLADIFSDGILPFDPSDSVLENPSGQMSIHWLIK